MTSKETNWGIAIETTKSERNKALHFTVFLLISIAKNKPPKKQENVAEEAQGSLFDDEKNNLNEEPKKRGRKKKTAE